MPAVDTTNATYGLRRQWSLCLLMMAAAMLVCSVARIPLLAPFASPLRPVSQALWAVGLSVVACLNAWVSYKFVARRPVPQHTIGSYARLDLRGWNPVLLAAAAGIGEEVLFRGALQTVLGIWASSALFVLAHTKAYRFNVLNRRVLVQAGGLFMVSLALGCTARYAGLIPAIVVHTVTDITGLYTVRSFIRAERTLQPR